MRRATRCRWRVAALLVLCFSSGLLADEFDGLRSYWASQLTGTNNSASTLNSRANAANSYWSSINTNSSRANLWSDLPLGTVSANVNSTVSRLKAMALAWATPGCSLQGNSKLAAAVADGLDWMCAQVYTATASEYDNWWHWEIGTPQALNDTVVLLYPALTGSQITDYISSVDHFSPPAKSWMTGANLSDKCKVVLIRGILGKSSAKMSYGQTNLSPVFPYVTSGDGFYTDGSFRQHTVLAYTGTYGNVLLNDIAQLANLVNGSTWQLTDPNLVNVYAWVTNSFAPLIYNGAMMDMVRGRAISRQGETELNDGSSTISAVRQIARFAPPATAAVLTNWANSPRLPPGQFHFASMDRVVALRPGFGFGLSLSSSRIANYESINGENLHGWFTGDGMTYLYLGSTETQFAGDFWPTVDPYHLPGTTVQTKARANSAGEATTTSQNWVGGAQVARTYGLAGMALAAYGTTLTARKSWFMFDNEIVCLGAGITCGDAYPIDTTVENRRLGSPPAANLTVNGITFPPTLGWSSNLTGVSWCALDGVGGYYFPGAGASLQAACSASTGSWSQINTGGSTNLYTDNYLKLWFSHGIKPTNATYAYVLLPNLTASAMSAYAASPAITVLTNSPTIQAVSKPALGVVAANFWTDGAGSADLLSATRKCSVITWETSSGISVGVSDPTQTNTSTITVTLNRSAAGTVSADPGVTVVQLSPQIVLSVNVKGSLGKTYQAAFRYPRPRLTWDALPAGPGVQDGSGSWDGVATNWWNGSAQVAWNDSASWFAGFGSGGTAGIVTLPGARTADSLVFQPVGSGSYILSGPGPLTLANGIAANETATLAIPLVLAGDQTWTVGANKTLAVSGALSAPAAASLFLAGPGTVRFNGGDNVLSSGDLVFCFNDNTILDLGQTLQTSARVRVADGVTAAQVSGAGGTLVLEGDTDMKLGGTAAGQSQGLALFELQAFIFNQPTNRLSIGGQVSGVSGAAADGSLTLARSNTITAATFGVADTGRSVSATSWNTGSLNLGFQNSLNANWIQIGGNQAFGAVRFAAGLPANPTLVIRGTSGSASRANLAIGTGQSSNYEPTQGTLDLVSGVNGACQLDARVGNLTLGQVNYGNGTPAFGTLVLGGGTLDATSILIGCRTSNATGNGVVTGSLTNYGTTITVQTLTLGSCDVNASSPVTANFVLQAGGTLKAQTIQPGQSLGTGILKRNFYWNDGVIANYNSADLTISLASLTLSNSGGLHAFAIDAGHTGLVSAVLKGVGDLTKLGAGALTLTASNTVAGNVRLNAGLLALSGGGSLNASSAFTLAPGAVLDVSGFSGSFAVGSAQTLTGSGTVNGNVRVNGTVVPGNPVGALVFNQDLVLAGTTVMQLSRDSGQPRAGQLVVSGNLTYGGRLVVTNIGSNALQPGDTFKLFAAASCSGSFSNAVLPALASPLLWTNRLALDGTLAVTTPLSTAPTNILCRLLDGNGLVVTWPADHTGWRLETQTNTLVHGLGTNWSTVPGSAATNQAVLALDPSREAVFFRLVYP